MAKEKFFKTLAVIWTRVDPRKKEMDFDELADMVASDDAYCSSTVTSKIESLEDDEDFDGDTFFDLESDVGADVDDEETDEGLDDEEELMMDDEDEELDDEEDE